MFSEATALPDSALEHQRQLWLRGDRPSIDSLLAEHGLSADSEALLDLLYHEVVLREELGEKPQLSEYAEQYPGLEEDLRLHFEVHQAVQDQVQFDTATPHAATSWPSSNAADLLTDVAHPDYDIERLIGQGAMASVYLSRHRRLKRAVALKLFQSQRPLSTREISRIRTEAEATARLTHPNIVPIFEIGEHQGTPFLALEYAAGGTLAQRLLQSPLTADAAADLVEQLSLAVQHAHDQEILHRDLKPANILFSADGTPKITDFGLAKILEDRESEASDVTRTGEAIGTPRYMSPEQASGRHDLVGTATDVYALGTILYECLTGRAPFVSAHVQETLQQIRAVDPTPPRRLQPSIPLDLETICLHCLEKDPRRRYVSAQQLANDLRRFQEGKPILARPTSSWEHARKWCRRNPAHAGLIALVVLLCSGSLLAAVVVKQRQASHIAEMRREEARLVHTGQLALSRDELEAAQADFHQAWLIVQSEPALADHETSITGWLDHSRNAINRYHWKQRVPPRDFDDRRDEALLLAALPFSVLPDSIEAARAAIQEALELTLPDDTVWRNEREQLVLVESALIAQQSGPQAALDLLEGTVEFDSQWFHSVRADYLRQLRRMEEAKQARIAAEKFPQQPIPSHFHTGLSDLRARNYESALTEFEWVLFNEPEHFTSRLFQSLCLLRLNRSAEATIALTACIAQRPRFAWSHLLRSQIHELSGNTEWAIQDAETARSNRPSHALLQVLESMLRDDNVRGPGDLPLGISRFSAEQ